MNVIKLKKDTEYVLFTPSINPEFERHIKKIFRPAIIKEIFSNGMYTDYLFVELPKKKEAR